MNEKVLIIDDDPQICLLLEDFLREKSYSVFSAHCALKGLELLKSEQPHAILLDVRLPDLNGIKAIKTIREISSSVGIIMISGLQDENVAAQAIALGASDYIVKPFDLDYLEKSLLVKIASLPE